MTNFGLDTITSAQRTPRMNAVCERVIGPLCRELLNRTLKSSGERHLALAIGDT